MASIFINSFDEPLTVRRGGHGASERQALLIEVDVSAIGISIAEARQLIADLSREVAAAEAAARGVAA